MISNERIERLQKLDIRVILDDFEIKRTDYNCHCPNPAHDDKHPSCIISYPDNKKYFHMSVYCYAEGERWDPLNLYMLLKGYDRKTSFVKAVYEMEKRYLNEDNYNEIQAKKKIIKSDAIIREHFSTPEEEQQFINDMLLNKIDRFLVKEWVPLDSSFLRFTSKSIDEYFEARFLDISKIYQIINKSNIHIYHQYDKKYNSNFILYLIVNGNDKFIIRKRIDGYLKRNQGKVIKKLKGNIGNPVPVWFYPEHLKNETKKLMIITEGLEDAFTAAHINSGALIVSLNSTNLVYAFINAIEPNIDKYREYTIIIAMDKDNAGYKALSKIKDFLESKEFILGKTFFTYKFQNNSANDLNEDWIIYKKSLKDRT